MSESLLSMDMVTRVIEGLEGFNDLAFRCQIHMRFSRDISSVPSEVRVELWRFLMLYRLNTAYRHSNEDVTTAIEIRLDDIALNKLQAVGYGVEALLGIAYEWDEMAAHYWSGS